MKPTIRTTISDFISLPLRQTISGLYVIACYPSLGCLYIGQSNDIMRRMLEHLCAEDMLGEFLRSMYFVSILWRLDIFEINDPEDRYLYEKKLIAHFKPEYNLRDNTRNNDEPGVVRFPVDSGYQVR